jgi:hypothetical protein
MSTVNLQRGWTSGVDYKVDNVDYNYNTSRAVGEIPKAVENVFSTTSGTMHDELLKLGAAASMLHDGPYFDAVNCNSVVLWHHSESGAAN